MRKIGIIGGMSSQSSGLYYSRLNDEVRRRLGGLHAAEIILWSVDFAEIAPLQEQEKWAEAGAQLSTIARKLEQAGADVILLATNTMHKIADKIAAELTIPFLHIADATAERIVAAGFKCPGFMGTRFSMEQDFILGRLRDKFGLEPIVPEEADRADIHRIIYDELCQGKITASSRQAYEKIAARLVEQGADCLILGCTEVGLLLNHSNVTIPVFDTVDCHVLAAVDFALSEATPVAPTFMAAE